MTAGPVVFKAKIRNRILVRILAAASLALVVMGLVLYLLTRQLLHTEITAKSEAMVTLVAASMERWLVEKSAALAVLADVEAQYTAPHPAQHAYFTIFRGTASWPFLGHRWRPVMTRNAPWRAPLRCKTPWPR